MIRLGGVRWLAWGSALALGLAACGREHHAGSSDSATSGGAAGSSGTASGAAGGAGVGGSSGAGSSGGGSPGTGGRPSAGVSGDGGAANSATAGDGGAAPLGGAAGKADGDAAGGDAAGGDAAGGDAAGGGRMGGAGGVLDPNQAVPSHDCREDPGPDGCVSVAGVYDGMMIDQYIDAADCRDGGTHAGMWVVGCRDVSDGPVVLDVPMVPPGPFSGSAGPDDPAIVEFYFLVDDATDSVTHFADNLVTSEIEGTVVVTNQPYRIVSGTFHAVWGPPESTCQSLYGGPCATAELNVTFRTRTSFGSCFSDMECTAPQICDPVGLFCTSP